MERRPGELCGKSCSSAKSPLPIFCSALPAPIAKTMAPTGSATSTTMMKTVPSWSEASRGMPTR